MFAKGKQKEFLEAVIQNPFGTQAALSGFLGVNKSTVRGWLNDRNILKSDFDKILDFCPEHSWFSKFIEEELPLNWGQRKG